MKLEHSLTPYTKINSEWFKHLNIKHDTIKLLEKNIGKTFLDINRSYIFLGQTFKAKEIKAKINKWDLIHLKPSAQQRKPSTKLKNNLWNGRKYLQMLQLTKD